MDCNDLVDGVLEYVPPFAYVQSKFETIHVQEWLRNYRFVSVIASAVYVILLFGGQKWMSTRPAYDLRGSLLLWNTGLAVFSLLGMLSLLPPIVHAVYLHGFEFAFCEAPAFQCQNQSLWGLLYTFSKIIEFGDTLFVVLRKKPLQFIHWYHHVTVCIYSFYLITGVTGGNGTSARWLCAMNFTVHTVMYSYFALRAIGINVPSRIALVITIMQISQMFWGLFINFMSHRLYLAGKECGIGTNLYYFGMAIYGSYALLFLHFFYDRYLHPKNKKE